MQPEYKYKQIYNPKSNRLQNYDYSSNWWYFITICTKDRQNYFGEIINWEIILNDIWKIAEKYYLEIPKHFPDVILDYFIIMPNHIHWIIIISKNNDWTVETKNFLSLQQDKNNNIKMPKWTSKTIWSIIRWFKIGVTKCIRENTDIYQIWQPNYYDRIIRNEIELDKIRKYIIENPLKWEFDKNNEENIFM
jgi:REP element-mobilizing transposase RayT